MRFAARFFLGVLGVALSLCSACRSKEALTRECTKGRLEACAGACEKGVAGEGGCFSAGQIARRGASTEPQGLDEALGYFQTACSQGHGDGCLFAAQIVEAPHAPRSEGAPARELAEPISDEALSRRDELLQKACGLGSVDGCKRFGDVYVGKNRKKALEGYDEACGASAAKAECIASRRRLADALEQQRSLCRGGVADACTTLGNVLYRIDAPRAVKLFITEAQLRGVADLAGGMGSFVRQRIQEARRGDPFAELDPAAPAGDGKARRSRSALRSKDGGAESPAVAAAADSPELSVEPVRVRGRLLRSDVQRRIELAAPALQTCQASNSARPAVGTAAFELVVDATGDVWRAERKTSSLPARFTACLESELSRLGFARPEVGPVHVDVTLSWQAGTSRRQ